jgi:AcrR family transcriptional regulator
MESVRELAKEARRQAILAAAEALIRKTGSTDFSMRDLAARAGLSLVTTYNLIGSKSMVLYALLSLRADGLSAAPASTPGTTDLVRVINANVHSAIRQFTGDPEFYRPLMRFLLGVPEPVHRPAFMARAISYWRDVMAPLEEAGWLAAGVCANDLADVVHLVFTGALDMWIHEEYDEARFQQQLDKSVALLIRPMLGADKGRRDVKRAIE